MATSNDLNTDTFVEAIHLNLDEWLEKLPPDFDNIIQHDGQYINKDEFKTILAALADFGFDDNELVKNILTECGDVGRLRFMARIAKEMQFDGIFTIEMLAKISPDDNGMKGTLDRLKLVLSERMAASLTGDVRFQKMLKMVMPELAPTDMLARPQKELETTK